MTRRLTASRRAIAPALVAGDYRRASVQRAWWLWHVDISTDPPDAARITALGEWDRARMTGPARTTRPECYRCGDDIPLGRTAVRIDARDPYARDRAVIHAAWTCYGCVVSLWPDDNGGAA